MLQVKDHWQIEDSSGALDLAVVLRAPRRVAGEYRIRAADRDIWSLARGGASG